MRTHLPLFRHGTAYRSLDTAPVPRTDDGPATAEVSVANPALIRRDLGKLPDAQSALDALTVDELSSRIQAAAEPYRSGTISFLGLEQSAEDYLVATSSSTGLPHTLVRQNLDKIAGVCANLPHVLRGLTLGLESDVLDRGIGEHHGVSVAYLRDTDALAALLPSNSPGVHSLWIPALALKTPVALKPGAGDPWTPYRIAGALIQAGVPAEAFGLYPTDHAGGQALVEAHGRALVFGGPAIAQRYGNDPTVQVHGPGYAKIWLAEDEVDRWEDHLDLILTSVARNGGRSCINASTLVVPRHADAIAEAIAARLAKIEALPLDHPKARLAASAPELAQGIDARIQHALASSGRLCGEQGPRLATAGGRHFLLPTVVRVPRDHALAQTEFGFPFLAVVECPDAEVLNWMGPTLVLTGLTHDPIRRTALLRARQIDRLHLGPVPTTQLEWDQPHEGNLFNWLWRRRAIGVA